MTDRLTYEQTSLEPYTHKIYELIEIHISPVASFTVTNIIVRHIA